MTDTCSFLFSLLLLLLFQYESATPLAIDPRLGLCVRIAVSAKPHAFILSASDAPFVFVAAGESCTTTGVAFVYFFLLLLLIAVAVAVTFLFTTALSLSLSLSLTASRPRSRPRPRDFSFAAAAVRSTDGGMHHRSGGSRSSSNTGQVLTSP